MLKRNRTCRDCAHYAADCEAETCCGHKITQAENCKFFKKNAKKN